MGIDKVEPFLDNALHFIQVLGLASFGRFKVLEDGKHKERKTLETEWLLFGRSFLQLENLGLKIVRTEVFDEPKGIWVLLVLQKRGYLVFEVLDVKFLVTGPSESVLKLSNDVFNVCRGVDNLSDQHFYLSGKMCFY